MLGAVEVIFIINLPIDKRVLLLVLFLQLSSSSSLFLFGCCDPNGIQQRGDCPSPRCRER